MKTVMAWVPVHALVWGWVAGTVVAHGWWKLAAYVVPPYAWYLVVERLMTKAGWV